MDDRKRSRQELTEELERLQKALSETESRVEKQAWGIKKTNDALKFLYKELEAKNKRLQEMNQLKTDFISTVSHELRTPLAIIKDGICIILEKIAGKINKKQEKILIQSKEGIERLERIINNLLDITKIEAGKIKLKREMVDMAVLVKEIAAAFKPKAEKKGLGLKVNAAGISAYVDRDRIIQVFTNLVGNAMKFTEKGSIEISCAEKGKAIECYVADTGRGISKENMPKVFNRFRQFDRSDYLKERGAGLGLSIAKSIIEIHKGRIWFESVPGKGTKFIFTIPRYTAKKLFAECVDSSIQDAARDAEDLSILLISLAGQAASKNALSAKDIESILKDIENMLDNSLRQTGDAVVRDADRIYAVLSGCGKEDASSIILRQKQNIENYLIRQKINDRVSLHFKSATYPAEAQNAEGLLKKTI